MKKFFFVVFLAIFTCCAAAQQSLNIYTGTFTSEGAEGIYMCSFDNLTGEISLERTFKGIDNPSFLKVSPDKKFLYSVTRPSSAAKEPGGYVNAYRIEPDGNLQFINKQDSHGADPCHVDVSGDGKFVVIATYGGGTISLYEVDKNGGLKPAVSTVKNKGSGPNQSRQKAPHAHSVKFSPDGHRLFSADLGTDQLNIFDFKKKKLVPAEQAYAKLAPGAGPRHFDFHPDGKVIYVINELNSTVTAFKNSGKEWQEFQTISTIPEDYSGTNFCADIHVSSDGRFLYGSNRGHNSIAVYKINGSTKELEWLSSVSTEGDWPRNFTLSPDGRFMIIANQRSNNISVFSIDQENGIPVFTGKKLNIPSPVCLEFH
jgi:6-phosphogluconolactonase